jgi:hypothetical protein
MSEDQAIEWIQKASDDAISSIGAGDGGAAGGYAVLAFKVARHLEWVQMFFPPLRGDGSDFIEAVKDWEDWDKRRTNAIRNNEAQRA